MNLKVFNMIKAINELKTPEKHILCKLNFEFDGRNYNLRQKCNYDKCQLECKNECRHRACYKGYLESV